MYLNNKFILCLGIMFLSACASNNQVDSKTQLASNDQTSADSPAAEKTLAAEDQKICKTRPITGSRFKQKICMTAKEWENMSYETKKMLNKSTRSKVRTDP